MESQSDQLSLPNGIYVDDNQSIYIADSSNHRIMKWKRNATNGRVAVGGNGQGSENNQLNHPSDVLLDKEKAFLIICDSFNRRIVRWPRENRTEGEIIIADVDCHGLTMDDQGYLYTVDSKRCEVKRWKIGDADGIIVAGGNGKGNNNNQFDHPTRTFVDQNYSVYVSDSGNSRVLKWMQNAKEGIIVTSRPDSEDTLTQVTYPMGIFIDQLGHLYVVDFNRHHIMRWLKGASKGSIILGGQFGSKPNQFFGPMDFTFDGEGSIYVVDVLNHRIQKFYIDLN